MFVICYYRFGAKPFEVRLNGQQLKIGLLKICKQVIFTKWPFNVNWIVGHTHNAVVTTFLCNYGVKWFYLHKHSFGIGFMPGQLKILLFNTTLYIVLNETLYDLYVRLVIYYCSQESKELNS